MKKNILALFLAVLMVLGSLVPVLNAEGNEKEDKIYYWKVYQVDIAPGEENLIEWINPTNRKGRGYGLYKTQDIGYKSIEFHNLDGDNYVFGVDQILSSEVKVGDTFYDIGSGHSKIHKRKLSARHTPLMKNTITRIRPYNSKYPDGWNNIDVDSLYAYKHIGYARSYKENTFKNGNWKNIIGSIQKIIDFTTNA